MGDGLLRLRQLCTSFELEHERLIRLDQAGAEIPLRTPSEDALGARRVHAASLEFSASKRGQVGLEQSARRRLKNLENGHHVSLRPRRDVEHASFADGPKHRAGDVVDMDVITGGAAEPEQRRRLAAPELVAEDRHDARLAMRALPRSVDVPEPAHGVWNIRRVAPCEHVSLSGPFRGAVRGQRGRNSILGRRDRRLISVNRASGGAKDDGCSMALRRFEHVERSLDVYRAVVARIGDRDGYAGLRGEVEDRFWAGGVHDLVERSRICDVDDLEERLSRDAVSPTAGQIIDRDRTPTLGDNRIDDVGSDESRASGDDYGASRDRSSSLMTNPGRRFAGETVLER